MLGIPEKDSDLFIKWIHEILELGIHDQQVLMKAAMEMREYFGGLMSAPERAVEFAIAPQLRVQGDEHCGASWPRNRRSGRR